MRRGIVIGLTPTLQNIFQMAWYREIGFSASAYHLGLFDFPLSHGSARHPRLTTLPPIFPSYQPFFKHQHQFRKIL